MSNSNSMSIQLEDINKPAINAAHVSERGIIIKQEHINRIKCPNISRDAKLNNALTYYCKWILNRQMTSECLELYMDFDNDITEPVRYGELVVLVSTVAPYSNLRVCYGDYNSITTDSRFNELLKLAKKNVLITIHNHPGGGGLSWIDIKQFINCDSVVSQVVVTNHGRLFWMTKMLDFNKDEVQAEISRIEKMHPASKGVILGSNEDIQLQRIRRAVIEPKLHEFGIIYRTIG